MTFLQNPRNLYCNSSTWVCHEIHSDIFPTLLPPTSYHLPEHMCQGSVPIALQPSPPEKLCPTLGPLKNWQPFLSSRIWTRAEVLYMECAATRTEGSLPGAILWTTFGETLDFLQGLSAWPSICQEMNFYKVKARTVHGYLLKTLTYCDEYWWPAQWQHPE